MSDQNADEIIAAAGGANPLAVAMLQLCQISYDASGIRTAIGNLPPFPGVPGKWYPLWGPAWNLIDSNLAFVAGYYRDGASSPLFTAVVTRGTDVDIWDPLGILWQIWEDLDPENPVPLPWPNNQPDAWIAGGTADGLGVIQSVTWNGWQLKDWLTNFLAQPGNSSTFLIVTGHSLGGCLTTVVAPWLKTTLPKPPAMLPMTFAAPSAGNAAFAGAFTRMFPASYRYQNPLDIVPLAYANLPAIITLYDQCSIPIPWEVRDAIGGMEYLIKGLEYQQPNSLAPPLPVTCFPTTSWYDEAGYQHHTTTYMNLLDGMNVGRMSRMTGRRGARLDSRAIAVRPGK
jgi:triacylglycerol lipase